MKTVMILGAGPYEVPVIERAIDMGHRVVVVDRSNDAPGFHVPGVIVERFSISDQDRVLATARTYQIDGIIASVDAGVRSAAYVATVLRLPGISEETAFMGTDKAAMRERLKERAVPIPLFFRASTKEEYLDAVGQLEGKCVVKAPDSSGSRGVYLLKEDRTPEEVDRAYDYSKQFSTTGELLVEEFMEGPEICVETLSQAGVCYPVQITDQSPKEPPFFTDCGFSQPSLLSEKIQQHIRQIAIDANLALENFDGSSCTELIVTEDGPKIVEVGVRLAGDFMATGMPLLSCGVDMSSEVVKVALGEPVDVTPKIHKASCVRYFMKERVGKIVEIRGVEEARAMDGVIDVCLLKGVGETASVLRKSSDRLCLVMAQKDTVSEAVACCEAALERIDFIVE